MCKMVVNNLRIETTKEGAVTIEAIAPAEDKVIDFESKFSLLCAKTNNPQLKRNRAYIKIGAIAAFGVLKKLGYTVKNTGIDEFE